MKFRDHFLVRKPGDISEIWAKYWRPVKDESKDDHKQWLFPARLYKPIIIDAIFQKKSGLNPDVWPSELMEGYKKYLKLETAITKDPLAVNSLKTMPDPSLKGLQCSDTFLSKEEFTEALYADAKMLKLCRMAAGMKQTLSSKASDKEITSLYAFTRRSFISSGLQIN